MKTQQDFLHALEALIDEALQTLPSNLVVGVLERAKFGTLLATSDIFRKMVDHLKESEKKGEK